MEKKGGEVGLAPTNSHDGAGTDLGSFVERIMKLLEECDFLAVAGEEELLDDCEMIIRTEKAPLQ